MKPRAIWLIGKSVLIESVRRREIYVIVLLSCLIIGTVMTLDFFGLEGLTKFYRETALTIMSLTTGLTVIALAARQLPREFTNRTIYPLLAKPVSRLTFLFGKLLGVMLAATFCFSLFMAVYVAGSMYLHGAIPWPIFAQYIFLQLLAMLILATLSFWLSMVLNLDAAITLAVIFYLTASTYTSITTYIYGLVGPVQRAILFVLNYALPQLTLFDLSEKTVHDEVWRPLSFGVMSALTLYGLVFATIYFSLAMLSFRRRPL
jgi:ABC-type transport system involved in multi-copper enzyme maturation permease subunit